MPLFSIFSAQIGFSFINAYDKKSVLALQSIFNRFDLFTFHNRELPLLLSYYKEETMKYEKLSARMASLLNEYVSFGAASMVTTARAVPLASSDPMVPPKVFVYLRCDENAVIAPLPEVSIHAAKGKVRTALVSLDSLDSLSERDEIYRISPAVLFKPLNNVAATKTNLVSFKNNTGLSGKNVIVGVVD